VCVQTSQEPGYKCRCAGTGYYGARCETSNKLRDEIDNDYYIDDVVLSYIHISMLHNMYPYIIVIKRIKRL